MAVALPLVLAAAATLAETPNARVLPLQEGGWLDGLRLSLVTEGTYEADYGDADVSWVRTTGRASVQGPVSDNWGVGASLSTEFLSSQVDADPSFLAGAAGAPAAAGGEAPLRDLFESTLTMGVRRRVRERFALGVDGVLSAKLEPGAELGDALKGGGVLSFAYRPSETFDLITGVKIGSRFDRGGVGARPLLGIEWNITPQLEMELRNTNLRFAYTARDGVELLVFAGMQADRYRLERRSSGPLADEPGTISFREATVGVGLRWFVTEHLRLSGTAGVTVWQRLQVNDASGREIASRDMEGVAPVIALRLQGRF